MAAVGVMAVAWRDDDDMATSLDAYASEVIDCLHRYLEATNDADAVRAQPSLFFIPSSRLLYFL